MEGDRREARILKAAEWCSTSRETTTGAEVLDYIEGGPLASRRLVLSEMLDSVNPDYSEFYVKGGHAVIQSGAADSRASSGAQQDYYDSIIRKMGRDTVNEFARIFVMGQAGHGLTGSNFTVNGDGQTIAAKAIPSTWDRTAMMVNWVEKNVTPTTAPVMTGAGGATMLLCSYPQYPRYLGNNLPTTAATSYSCTTDRVDRERPRGDDCD